MGHPLKTNRNLVLFLIGRALWIPFFWLPILYIYLIEFKHFSPVQTTFLLGLQELLLIFLELPTGVIADKVSRKLSVALGYVLTSLPFVFIPFINAYYVVVILFVVKAVGKALISGADSSLLYDMLVDLDMKNEYKRINSLSKSLYTIVTAICIFIGGVLAKDHIDWTLILPFPLMLIGAVAFLLIEEPQVSKRAKLIQDSNYFRHTWNSIKYVLKNSAIYIPIIIFVVSDSLSVNLKWFYTPILTNVGLSIAFISTFTALLYFIKSGFSFIVTLLGRGDTNKLITIANALLFLFFGLIAFISNSFLVLIFLIVIILASEILDSFSEQIVHDSLSSEIRATAMSFINLLGSVGATVMINSWGVINQIFRINAGILGLALVFFVTFILSLFRIRSTSLRN